MFTSENTLAQYKEIYSMYFSDNSKVSRTLRRFIQRVAPKGFVSQILLDSNQPMTEDEVKKFTACAEQIRKYTCEELMNSVGEGSFTDVDVQGGLVHNVYPLGVNLETASLPELRSAAYSVLGIVREFRNYAENPQRAVHRFTPEYAEEQRELAHQREVEANERIMKYLGMMD